MRSWPGPSIVSAAPDHTCQDHGPDFYAARQTTPNGSGALRSCSALQNIPPSSIRHSHSASRNSSKRSFGRKRVRLLRLYGLSLARAATRSSIGCATPLGQVPASLRPLFRVREERVYTMCIGIDRMR
jgi:hypothetical protein